MKNMNDNQKILVVIPTYNERDSIFDIVNDLNNLDFQILIVDDNSPDETAEFVKSLQIKNVDILHRKQKTGLGAAYVAGIKYALEKKTFTHLVSMDGDGSHQVNDLKLMCERLKTDPNCDLILGSRWVPGGAIRNWSALRSKLSKAGTKYAKWALKLDINDLTGGFRIYSRQTLEKLNFEKITSNGYCYQIEMVFAISQINKQSEPNKIQENLKEKQIIEVPITFIERKAGSSKMNLRIVLEAIWKVTTLGATLRINTNADKLHYVK